MKLSLGARPLAITATAVLALLVLTGYTVAPNNLIVWSYLGQTPAVPAPYNASGVAAHSGYSNTYPDSLSVPPLPADFKARIALTSPEKSIFAAEVVGVAAPTLLLSPRLPLTTSQASTCPAALPGQVSKAQVPAALPSRNLSVRTWAISV